MFRMNETFSGYLNLTKQDRLDSYQRNENFTSNANGESSFSGVADLFKTICFVLSVSGIILNIVVIVSMFSRKMKTNLKLAVSLATADMLTAAFHLTFAFQQFVTQWTLSQKVSVTLETYDGVLSPISFELLPQSTGWIESLFRPVSNARSSGGGTLRSSPQNALGGNITNDINQHFNESLSGFNCLYLTESRETDQTKALVKAVPPAILQALCFILPNVTSVDIDTENTQTTRSAFFAAFYFMPNIAAVLSMLAITTLLLITVLNPLKQHLIVSKSRGTRLVLAIWMFAALVSLVLFIFLQIDIMDGKAFSLNQVLYILNAQELHSIVVSLIFIVIFAMYIIILYQVSLKRLQVNSSIGMQQRRIANRKATITALAITGSYAVCYLPSVWRDIMHMTESDQGTVEHNERVGIRWNGVLQSLFILNLNIDAIIYSFRLPEVTRGLKRLWNLFMKGSASLVRR